MPLRVNAMSFAKMLAEIRETPQSFTEIAEATGLHYTTVREYIRALHKEKLVHVAANESNSAGRGTLIRMWKLGEGKDKKNIPLTPTQRTQRYRDKRAAMRINHLFAGTTGVIPCAPAAVSATPAY